MGELSWFKSVFFEASRLWEQQDQLLRKSSQSKLLKIVPESKEIKKQLVFVRCQSVHVFRFEIRLRLNFAENLIFNMCFRLNRPFVKLCFYIHLELVNNSFVRFSTQFTTLINFSLILSAQRDRRWLKYLSKNVVW